MDVKVASKTTSELNEPVAVMELSTKSGNGDSTAVAPASTVRFDINREQMGGILKTLEAVQRKIDELGS